MVDTEVMSFDLPNMRLNPFNVKPLSSDDKQLLVGRKQIISSIIGWCKHRSARMVLLVGNRGTGRTSLLNLLGSEAYRHFQFNLFPTKDPMKNLLEQLYITVVSDFEVPRMPHLLQDNLIKSLPKTGRLPILSFDYPNISGSDISDVFKQITQIIRSLDAVSIIALTPSQLATWPQELIDEFDEEIRINSFDSKEIHEMIVKRVKSASRDSWNPPSGLVDEVEERTSGHPSESIKLMRKIVHNIKNSQENDSELNEIFTNIKSKMDNETEPKYENIQIDEEIEEYSYLDEEKTTNDHFIQEEEEEELIQEIKQDRFIEENIPNQNREKEVSLDLKDDLENIELISDDFQAPLPKGGFGRLSSRTRNTNDSMRDEGYALSPSDFEALNKTQDSPTLESPLLETEDVALWIDEEMISNTQFGREFVKEIENKNNYREKGDHQLQQKNIFEGGLKEMQINQEIKSKGETFDLDIDRLRNLDDNEIKVIQLSSKREISPSDDEMREILGGIGRTRLSQIFNGLNKHGILSVKKVGRSRMFYLSNSAKSQLSAWGIL